MTIPQILTFMAFMLSILGLSIIADPPHPRTATIQKSIEYSFDCQAFNVKLGLYGKPPANFEIQMNNDNIKRTCSLVE